VPPKLAPAWRDYLTRLAAVVVGLVGLVLWVAGARGLLGGLFASDAPLDALAAAWLTGWLWALGRLALFPCPYCGKWFHMTWWSVNPVTTACLHCGFAKWRDPDAARVLSRR
jgi:hypothetical protein